MRALLLATTALIAAPAAAQDHAAHAEQAAPDDTAPDEAHQHVSHGKAQHQHQHEADAAPGAMDHSAMDHGAMDQGAMDQGSEAAAAPASGPPPRAFEGPEHAADATYGAAAMALARADLAAMDDFALGTAMLERLEARLGEGEDHYLWDAQGWYGGDHDKIWLKSEGEGEFGGEVESAEVQALWSHAIGAFFDLQAGIRYDFEPDSRAHAVLGVQGLAPYMFEVDAAAFLSDRGDLTARIEAEYDQRITQRLILQPRAEILLAAQDIPERAIGAGITSVETGLRLRYEIAREFAPYVGVEYEAKLGDTADRARAAGDDPDCLSLLIGLRAWF